MNLKVNNSEIDFFDGIKDTIGTDSFLFSISQSLHYSHKDDQVQRLTYVATINKIWNNNNPLLKNKRITYSKKNKNSWSQKIRCDLFRWQKNLFKFPAGKT